MQKRRSGPLPPRPGGSTAASAVAGAAAAASEAVATDEAPQEALGVATAALG